MSDVGVHSTVYQRVRGYADLVDDVIVSLRTGHAEARERQRRELGDLLKQVGGDASGDLAAAWLRALLRSADGGAPADWVKVGEHLIDPIKAAQVLPQLEALADLLERRWSESLARMRGIQW